MEECKIIILQDIKVRTLDPDTQEQLSKGKKKEKERRKKGRQVFQKLKGAQSKIGAEI